MTRFWLVRHAPVPGGRITGQSDVACDVSDSRTLAALAAALPQGATLVESGLSRCRQTARALGLENPIVDPDLAEQNFGAWQGRSWSEIEAPEFWQAPATACPPGGESFAAVVDRVRRALLRYDGNVVAIIHAGSIRAALAVALDLDPAAALRFAIDPLSLTRIDRVEGGWRVPGVNRTFTAEPPKNQDVMAGLVPAIHVRTPKSDSRHGTRRSHVDPRDKPGDDDSF